MKTTIIISLLFCLISCNTNGDQIDKHYLDSLINNDLNHVLSSLNLEIEDLYVSAEPPGVNRIIATKPEKDREVYIYLRREEVGFSEKTVNVKDLLDKNYTVVGIAFNNRSEWIISGEVISYFHLPNE